MQLDEIQDKLRRAKDSFLTAARAAREEGVSVFPMVGAILADGSIRTWGLGPLAPEQMMGAVQQASAMLQHIGAVGGILAADGWLQSDDVDDVHVVDPIDEADAADMGLEDRALLVFLTATGWAESWGWRYKAGEEGTVAWEAAPAMIQLLSSRLGFSPFGVPSVEHVVH